MTTPKRYGFRVFLCSCFLSAVTIAVVLWDERQQRERRQVGVRSRIRTIQQQRNMQEYEQQKNVYEQYKRSTTS
ncbi:hypothetical protein AB6A40_001795 [Gnathostoma spinigerum]|uniref:Transmembrane protein n=1 Tax=Gnathostoma spinigerum TaxID=75299 RepID=A0ABD6ECJ0_9BILA